MNGKAAGTFTPPEYWSFRPLFTLQPVQATRDKQLTIWRDLILQYCIHSNAHVIIPQTFPYFNNAAIDRQLSPDAISSVIEYLIKSGNAEWQDGSQSALRIIWKSPRTLAGEIYAWATQTGQLDTVLTIYELHSGDENHDSGFHGTDPVTLRRALDLLESTGKCTVISGSVPEEDGVKFNTVTV